MKGRIKKSILLIAIGIVVNVALAAIKMYVGLASNSLCIMLDAMNSFFDTLTCIVTLIVFIVLLLPKGEKAPYAEGNISPALSLRSYRSLWADCFSCARSIVWLCPNPSTTAGRA